MNETLRSLRLYTAATQLRECRDIGDLGQMKMICMLKSVDENAEMSCDFKTGLLRKRLSYIYMPPVCFVMHVAIGEQQNCEILHREEAKGYDMGKKLY